MHGDANLYLRTVLDHLYTRDMDGMAKAAWSRNRDIDFYQTADGKPFLNSLTVAIQAHEWSSAMMINETGM